VKAHFYRTATFTFLLVGLSFAPVFSAHAADVDTAAAEALAKKSNCLKCHALDKKKDGPSFKETAAKYKGKADAEKTLYTHLTTSPKIKVDGKEETHDAPKTKNEADIRNLVAWILSR
jgi:cytochrome c